MPGRLGRSTARAVGLSRRLASGRGVTVTAVSLERASRVPPRAKIEVWIEGRPKAWERPNPKRGRRGGMFTSPAAAAYAKLAHTLALAARPAGWSPLEGPVRFTMRAWFPFKAGELWYPHDPDESNIQKLLEDALEGVAYVNDNQICETSTRKLRAPSVRHAEGVYVLVEAL